MTAVADEVLSAYIDGELEPAEAARVALILARDPAAMERLKALRASDDLLRTAFQWRGPDEAALRASLAAEMARERRWRPARLIGLAAACVLLAFTMGVAVGVLVAGRTPRAMPIAAAPARGQAARSPWRLRRAGQDTQSSGAARLAVRAPAGASASALSI